MADYIHEDNTGHGGSVAFKQQRARASDAMATKESWQSAAGVSAELPPSPARAKRSSFLHNLRASAQVSQGGGPYSYDDSDWIARNRKHIETYGSDPT
jgi:hypothetical protein